MTDEQKAEHELKLRRIDAEIAHLLAQTTKLNKETKWYEIIVISGATLAIAALANAIF